MKALEQIPQSLQDDVDELRCLVGDLVAERAKSSLIISNVLEVLTTVLRWVVRECTSTEQAVDVLRAIDVTEELERIVEDVPTIEREADLPDSLTAAHVSCLLGNHGLARRMVDLPCAELTPFWEIYRRALRAVLCGQPLEVPEVKVTGYDKALVPYVQMMADLCNGREPDVDALDKEFAKRQKNKRIEDLEMLSGDGHAPVTWDFRRAAIFMAAGRSDG